MRLLVICTLLALFSIQCVYGSNLQLKKFCEFDRCNVFECLDTLISVTDWTVHNFLVISNGTDIVDNVLSQFQRYPDFGWKLYSTGNHNFTDFSNVILFANNFHNLNQTLSENNILRMDTRAKFLISITENFGNLNEIQIASKGIPAAMWKLDKTRVLYLVPCKNEIFAMTYFPFARNCQAGDLQILDVWRAKGFSKQAELLFPEKMLDIRGCVQNQSGIPGNYAQFQFTQEFSESGEMILGGVAGRLITIVAERMHMPLNLLPRDHGSWNCVINQIVLGESILSIAGNIPSADRAKILDLETTFMEESFAFGYLTGGFEVPWKNLVWPLSSEAWGYMGCSFLLFGSIILLLNRCHRRVIVPDKLTILDSFGIFLGGSRVLPRSYFGRYLLGMWIIYSFLINAFYNSGLISFLTTPNEQQVIRTLEELLADGMDFGGSPFHRNFYYDPSDPIMMKVYDNFKDWSEEEEVRQLLSSQGAIGIFSSTVYEHNRKHFDNVESHLRILEDKAVTFHAPIFMRRGSPFTIGVHRYSRQAVESGLFEHWRKHYTKTWNSARTSTDNPPKITMQHLRGIWYLLIAGLICSTVVFTVEIIFHKYLLNRSFCSPN